MIETNGFAGPQAYIPLLPYLDMVLIDFKTINPIQHEKLTGKPLDSVLDSIRFFYEKGKLQAVQQVIVPGYTDDDHRIQQTAQFLCGINPDIRLKLLRFRSHGVSGSALEWQSPSDETMDFLVRTAHINGLTFVERSL